MCLIVRKETEKIKHEHPQSTQNWMLELPEAFLEFIRRYNIWKKIFLLKGMCRSGFGLNKFFFLLYFPVFNTALNFSKVSFKRWSIHSQVGSDKFLQHLDIYFSMHHMIWKRVFLDVYHNTIQNENLWCCYKISICESNT